MSSPETIRGRGAAENPPNRFETVHVELSAEDYDGEAPPPLRTQFLRDVSKTIIATNDSPDIPFEASINPYRGCEHGCLYCYARPTHEYLGMSAGLDFESKIFVKENAADLLRAELSSRKWTPKVLAISGVTDAYQPVERRLGLTRRCLEVLREFRNPVLIITKNHLVTRDIDLLGELAEHQAVSVHLSITTLDGNLARILEPRTSTPSRRLAAVEALAKAGIPVGVGIAPVIPGITDHEIMSIVAAAASAGARSAFKVMLRLPHGVKDLFENWLDRHYPDRKDKVMNRTAELHSGRPYDSQFFKRQSGSGVYAEQIEQMFQVACTNAGLGPGPTLSTRAFRRPPGPQLDLFS